MWLWSISSERGIVSVAPAMLASPSRAVSVARSFGCPARFVCFLPPRNLVTSLGRNFNASQSEVPNGTEVVNELHEPEDAGLAPPPLSVAAFVILLQLVGLSANSFLDSSSAIDR